MKNLRSEPLRFGVPAGGILVILGWTTSRDLVVPFLSTEDKVVLGLGIFVALTGIGLVFESPRGRRMAAVAALVAAPPIVGLEINARLVAPDFHTGLGPSLIILGAMAAALTAAVIATRELASTAHVADGNPTVLLGAAGSTIAVTTFLEWQPSVGGMDLPPGNYMLGFGVAIVALAVVSLLVRDARIGAAAWTGATAIAAAAAALAVDIGFVIEPLDTSPPLYFLIAASLTAAAVGGGAIALRLGFPEPSFPAWVPATFAGLGLFGLWLGMTFAEEFEDAGGSVYGLLLGGTLLLLTGVGMLAGQSWAWFLGFPVALMGIANAILFLVFAEAKSYGWLALVLYVNALRALWAARGFTWTDGEPVPAEVQRTPAEVQPTPAPAQMEAAEPVATTPVAVKPEPVAPPPVAAEPSPPAAPPPVDTTPVVAAPRRGLPVSVQFVLGGVALVAIVVAAYTLGSGSEGETPAAPAAGGGAEATLPQDTMPTPETSFAPMQVLVTNATSDYTVRGCTVILKWNWFLDPSMAPPAGSDAFIEITGPQIAGVQVVESDGPKVTLKQEAGLINGGGTWTAELITVGDLPAFDVPIGLSYFPAC